MITLTQMPQNKTVEKLVAPGAQANDNEGTTGTTEDFASLVQHAKNGLATRAEKVAQRPEALLRKASATRDAILKQATELTRDAHHSEPQETLAALLNPAGKSSAGSLKGLLASQDKEKADNENDPQDFGALLAMLPPQQSAQDPSVTLSANTTAGGHTRNITLTTDAETLARQPSEEVDITSQSHADNGVTRLPDLSEKVSTRAGDGHQPTPANTQPAFSTMLSSSAPMIATGTPIAAPATPILNSQLGTQEWQQQLSQQVVLFTRQGLQHAELRLHPEHLGKVDINLKLDDNQLQLQIMSPHNHVRAAFEAAIPMLRTSLSESGLQLSQSQVGGEGSMPQQQTSQHEQQAARQHGTFSLDAQDDADIPIATSETLQSLAQGNGSVDIFA